MHLQTACHPTGWVKTSTRCLGVPCFAIGYLCHIYTLHTFSQKTVYLYVIATTYPGVYLPLPFKNGSGDPISTDILAFFTYFCDILCQYGCKWVYFWVNLYKKHATQNPSATEFHHPFWPKNPCF